MASDGEEFWTIDDPSRVEALRRMVFAIECWDLSTQRFIHYRSFEPILGLLRKSHTPECQHWAAWALANLTRVYREYIFVKTFHLFCAMNNTLDLPLFYFS